jgi:hypothetical protein
MKRFEYHVFKIGSKAGWFSAGGEVDTSAIDRHLNELGAEGWELISAFDTNMGHGATRDVIMIFKRERQD